MRFSKSQVAVAAAALPLALAQTSTSCDPLDKTCAADVGLDSSSYSVDFTSANANASWTVTTGESMVYGDSGAEFIITSSADAPTLSTDFYFLFGRVDVKLKVSNGTGIVSSVVLESDDLDEIDWEFLGGDTTQAQTNFFGKGNTTSYDRGTYVTVSTPQETWHTYSIDWTAARTEWLIDGVVVRTLEYDSALALEGANYPQTPMRVKLGSWCGGCSSSEGTVEWAGGVTSFDDAPYTMYVETVAITNYNPATEYIYSDKTGDWQSITIVTNSSDSSSASSASAVGSATTSITVASTATSAPTSTISATALSANSGVVQSTTITGSSYSTGTASSGSNTSTTASASKSTTSTYYNSATSIKTSLRAGSFLAVAVAIFLL